MGWKLSQNFSTRQLWNILKINRYISIVPSYDEEPDGFTTFLDFVYFAIITISTVGYGDFTPTLKLSRAMVVVFVCLIFSLIPTKVSRITELLNSRPLICGRLPPRPVKQKHPQSSRSSSSNGEHVLILGRATPPMILAILSELYSHYLVSSDCVKVPRYVVLLTPDASAIPQLEPLVKFAFSRYRVRFCAKYCSDYFGGVTGVNHGGMMGGGGGFLEGAAPVAVGGAAAGRRSQSSWNRNSLHSHLRGPDLNILSCTARAHNCRQRDGFPHSQGTELVGRVSVSLSGGGGLSTSCGVNEGVGTGVIKRGRQRVPSTSWGAMSPAT